MTSTSFVHAVVDPERFFSRRLTYADAVIPLLGAMFVGVWLSHTQQPYLARAVYASLPADAAQRFAADGGARLAAASWLGDLGAVGSPLLRIALVASFAFTVLGSWFRSPRFESLTVCAAWALLILVCKDVMQYGLLAFRGIDSVQGPTDLVPSVGFGVMASARPSFQYDVLELVNGFDLGYLLFLAVAIRVAENVRFREAMIATAIPWVLFQSVRIGFNVVFQRG